MEKTAIQNNITEDYCSFEVSKMLKEKGFDVSTNSFYNANGEIINVSLYTWNHSLETDCSRPTHALALKWVRVNFGICVIIEPIPTNKKWIANIVDMNNTHIGSGNLAFFTKEISINNEYRAYPTYEQSVEAAILYTLKNLIPHPSKTKQ